MSKAEIAGRNDAQDWMRDNADLDKWEAAVKPGALIADEGLVNSCSDGTLSEHLGVPELRDADGNFSNAAYEAFRAYSRAWRETVEAQIADSERD